MKLLEHVCRDARTVIAERLGLHFSEERLADLERGLVRALKNASVSDPGEYLSQLASLPDESPEWGRLAGELTVGETYFFRDHACFDALEHHVLPDLIATRRAKGLFRLRLWSAGCATGEEPYSLAILLDRLLPDRLAWTLTILATDINPKALDAARRGVYREWAFRETPSWIRNRYFRPREAQTFELEPAIRQLVTFAPINLVRGCYPTIMTNTTAMDLILCRNVLMYFSRETQQATVSRLQQAIVDGGWLAVSPTEASAELFRPLTCINLRGAVLFRKGSSGTMPTQAPVHLSSFHPYQPEESFPEPTSPAPPEDIHGDTAFISTPETANRPEPSPDRESILQHARSLADQGQLEKAHDLCQAVLANNRLDAEAHLLLAAISQERGEISGAFQALRQAIYLAPECAPAYFLLGSLLIRQGQQARGRRCMETVVELLNPSPRDETLPGTGGLTAGRLLETAQAYLAMADHRGADGLSGARRTLMEFKT